MVFAWDCFFNVTLEKTCKYTNDFFSIFFFWVGVGASSLLLHLVC